MPLQNDWVLLRRKIWQPYALALNLLTLMSAGKITILSDGSARFFQDAESLISAQWSGPHGSVMSKWYGWEIKVDGYLANKIIGGTWAAAGLAASLGVTEPSQPPSAPRRVSCSCASRVAVR